MKQPEPGPETRTLSVKLIDIMKYPIVPVSVSVPTRKQTLATNINAVNVQNGIPILIDLTVDENATLMTNNGQSRGVAQIKTKEKAEQCRDEGTTKKQTKAASKKKAVVESESEMSEDASGQDPWQSDSGQDPWKAVPVESDVESEESDHELEFFQSDHEFSQESDDETQIVPMKRARTAQDDNQNKIEGKWCACQKCKMRNNPESILLCDRCDLGYHIHCLVPMLFTIPEGHWFCSQCQQEKLIKSLENLLKNLDKGLIRQKAKKNAEIARRKRKEFASLNMLPDEGETVRKKSKRRNVAGDRSNGSSPSSSGSSSNSCSENNKPVYKLRERGQTKVNYRFADYDDLIKSSTSDAKGSDTNSETEDDGSDDSFRG
ncbi:remodeling and spacing factor 1-like isoform X2 [Bradysia coprophila]|uniref:remodeling and spacing factor 1-like isoform X2 n=1 Tax=Bradysia coprophila TaxID=38358 RepID=UPI00187DC22D|nr:remodeling and spacing factor 1-like isoform X2 [Bradysia coprophila]